MPQEQKNLWNGRVGHVRVQEISSELLENTLNERCLHFDGFELFLFKNKILFSKRGSFSTQISPTFLCKCVLKIIEIFCSPISLLFTCFFAFLFHFHFVVWSELATGALVAKVKKSPPFFHISYQIAFLPYISLFLELWKKTESLLNIASFFAAVIIECSQVSNDRISYLFFC